MPCLVTNASRVQKQVDRKVPLNQKMLLGKLEEVKGAVMICYPMGLPQWDAMRLIVEDNDEGTCSVCLIPQTDYLNTVAWQLRKDWYNAIYVMTMPDGRLKSILSEEGVCNNPQAHKLTCHLQHGWF
jgi:hypothetical protein